MATGSLGNVAKKVGTRAAWSDLVPADRQALAEVRELCRQLRAEGTGAPAPDGVGATVLFLGATGKVATTAAAAAAGAIGRDLYRIDLAAVVSKYIGETEKDLAALFDAAERSGAVLLFDEADALFGTRTDVKDSHDRIANLDLERLLARLEDYCGLAILATNRRTPVDANVLRRFPRALAVELTPGRR